MLGCEAPGSAVGDVDDVEHRGTDPGRSCHPQDPGGCRRRARRHGHVQRHVRGWWSGVGGFWTCESISRRSTRPRSQRTANAFSSIRSRTSSSPPWFAKRSCAATCRRIISVLMGRCCRRGRRTRASNPKPAPRHRRIRLLAATPRLPGTDGNGRTKPMRRLRIQRPAIKQAERAKPRAHKSLYRSQGDSESAVITVTVVMWTQRARVTRIGWRTTDLVNERSPSGRRRVSPSGGRSSDRRAVRRHEAGSRRIRPQ